MGTIHTGVVELHLTVRDMEEADLPHLACFYSQLDLEKMPERLERARGSVVDHLVVCTPVRLPVAKGAINYQEKPDAGVIWTLSVRTELRSLGIGTVLIGAAEDRIRARGLPRAEVGVEENNPRARALYERLAIRRTAPSPPPGSTKRRTARSSCTRRRARCCARTLVPPPHRPTNAKPHSGLGQAEVK